MTLREYFTKHPKFQSNGKFDVIDGGRLSFCGVPFNGALWQQLKENRLDDPIPDDVLAELETIK